MKPFIAADILLPAPQTDMGLWPALACDQFTSQPEYWQKAEALTQNAPSSFLRNFTVLYHWMIASCSGLMQLSSAPGSRWGAFFFAMRSAPL